MVSFKLGKLTCVNMTHSNLEKLKSGIIDYFTFQCWSLRTDPCNLRFVFTLPHEEEEEEKDGDDEGMTWKEGGKDERKRGWKMRRKQETEAKAPAVFTQSRVESTWTLTVSSPVVTIILLCFFDAAFLYSIFLTLKLSKLDRTSHQHGLKWG